MYEHLKGGRGKRASYKTVIVRLPEPLLERVNSLIMAFHDSVAASVNNCESEVDKKDVTGNNAISKLEEIIQSVRDQQPGFKEKSARKLIQELLELEKIL